MNMPTKKMRLCALLLLYTYTLPAFNLFSLEPSQEDSKEKIYNETLFTYAISLYTCVGITNLISYMLCNGESKMKPSRAAAILALHTVGGLAFSFFTKDTVQVPEDFLEIDLKPHMYPYKVASLGSLLVISLWVGIISHSAKRYFSAVLAEAFIFLFLEFIIFILKYNQIRIIRALEEKEETIIKLLGCIDELECRIRDMKMSNDVAAGLLAITRGGRCLIDAAGLGKKKATKKKTSSSSAKKKK